MIISVMHRHLETFGFFPFGVLSGLSGLLLLAGFVLLLVWLIRAILGQAAWRHGFAPTGASTPESPVDILSRRFAAGEITSEDFQKARDVLRETPKT
jgi:putative membrane protein